MALAPYVETLTSQITPSRTAQTLMFAGSSVCIYGCSKGNLQCAAIGLAAYVVGLDALQHALYRPEAPHERMEQAVKLYRAAKTPTIAGIFFGIISASVTNS